MRCSRWSIGVWLVLWAAAGAAFGADVKVELNHPVIICADDASVTERFAAETLAKAIEGMSGKRPSVTDSASGDRRSKIVLVGADLTTEEAVSCQSFTIKCIRREDQADVILTGKECGLLYAVRDLTRKYLSFEKDRLTVSDIDVRENPAVPRRYLWVWYHNLKGEWSRFIDFASEWKCNGVVIWGLDGWQDAARCKMICEYAHIRGVSVIHGFGLNGYHEGKHVCTTVPEAKGVIPEKFHNTKNGKWSLEAIYCPFNKKAKALVQEMLLKAADAGIDGFNFETADVDYILCHCPQCEAHFKHQNEEVQANKPIAWSIEHSNDAVTFLRKERPGLWLCSEYTIQKFAKEPYLGSAKLDALARDIDRRCTIIWCESLAPPQEIAASLLKMRPESGFYVRSGAILGIEGSKKYKWEQELEAMQRLIPLKPTCVMYRSGIPGGYLAAKMAIAAEAMWNPDRPDGYFPERFDEVTAQTKPGGKYHVE